MNDRRNRIPVRREQAGDVRQDLGGSGDRAGATVDESTWVSITTSADLPKSGAI
jgi:hypothetical protein